MRLVKGNKIVNFAPEEFKALLSRFKKVVVDLGTGDGRFVFKTASTISNVLYVGIDPAEKQMQEFSKRAVKKKLENVLFVVGSIEKLPEELTGVANQLNITLPWGTLLKSIAKPNRADVAKIKNLLKPNSSVEIIFGYDEKFEPTESDRLELEKIDLDYIKKAVIPVFEDGGFNLEKLTQLAHEDLKEFESTWGKKIAIRTERSLFTLIFSLHNN